MPKLIGYLGRCSTPYCGSIQGYFCVKCRHFVSECSCGDNSGGCACEGENYRKWWAGPGERRVMELRRAIESLAESRVVEEEQS